MDEEFGSFTRFPDLIMMDGGKGQVNIAFSGTGQSCILIFLSAVW